MWISFTYRINEYNNKYLYLKRELFYMVLVFLRLRRNFVERNAVITLYRDFLSSPTNCPGYCWGHIAYGWIGQKCHGSLGIKWRFNIKRTWRSVMKRITTKQCQSSEWYYKLPKILFEDEKYMDMKGCLCGS